MTTTAPQINLLGKRKRTYDQQSALALRARVWFGTGLVVYVVLLALLLAVNIYFTQSTKTSLEALDRARMSLISQSVVIKQHERLVVRVKTIESLLGERREVIGLWQGLGQILPENTELTEFVLKEDELSARVMAPDVLIANKVLDMVQNDINSIGIKSTKAQVSRGEDASYTINFLLSLDDAGKSE